MKERMIVLDNCILKPILITITHVVPEPFWIIGLENGDQKLDSYSV